MARSKRGRLWTFLSERPKAAAGGVLSALGFGFLIWLAVAGASDSPPSGAQAATLAIVTAVLQVSAAWLFAESGKPPEGVVTMALKDLVRLRNRAMEAEAVAEHAFPASKPGPTRDALGLLSVHASYLREGIEMSGEYWAVFHYAARRELEKEEDDA